MLTARRLTFPIVPFRTHDRIRAAIGAKSEQNRHEPRTPNWSRLRVRREVLPSYARRFRDTMIGRIVGHTLEDNGHDEISEQYRSEALNSRNCGAACTSPIR